MWCRKKVSFFAMFQFPSLVSLNVEDKRVEFKIVEVKKGVFALKNHLHALQNKDEVVFGYLVFADDYLYAYSIMESEDKVVTTTYSNATSAATETSPCGQKVGYELIYMSYVGPEDELHETDFIEPVFQAIGFTIIQMSRHRNKHPAIMDKDRFAEIYADIIRGLEQGKPMAVSPFINPIYDLAVELRDFYASMCCNLETIKDQFEAQNGTPSAGPQTP